MERRRPNVIVFFTDQQRWDSMAAHGNPLAITPNLDRMARVGTHVFNSFTCQPVCGPARSCLQTGQYATQTGCFKNAIPLRRDSRTLAHEFADAGYSTGYIGKWHLADEDIVGPVPRDQRGGYDYWLGANALELVSDAYRCVMYDNEDNEVLLPGYRVDAQTDAAIRYIDAHREEPFFLFLSYLEPHHQNHLDDYPPPIGYREEYTGRWTPPDLAALPGSAARHLGGYWGMIKRLDEAYGRLHDALRSLGIADDTVVLFTSDHGCHFKTRNTEYKRSCHESSVRVPTVLTGGPFAGGHRIEQLVSLVDLPPTLLDAAGLRIPATMAGRSIVPLLRDPSVEADWPHDVFIQISESQTGRAVRTSRWKYAVDAPYHGNDGAPVASQPVYQESFLYDLEADPYELENLIGLGSHREVADRLQQRLLERIQEVEGETPEIIPAKSRPGGQRVVLAAEIDC